MCVMPREVPKEDEQRMGRHLPERAGQQRCRMFSEHRQ